MIRISSVITNEMKVVVQCEYQTFKLFYLKTSLSLNLIFHVIHKMIENIFGNTMYLRIVQNNQQQLENRDTWVRI